MKRVIKSPPPTLPILVHLACLLSGTAALIYEVLWSRSLVVSLGNSADGCAAVLIAFMGAMGLGAVIIGRVADRIRDPLMLYAALEVALAGCALAVPALGSSVLPKVAAALLVEGSPVAGWVVRLAMAVALVTVPAAIMGATLPLVVRALARRKGDAARWVGWLYMVNTIGGCAGAAAAGFVLVPALGIRLGSGLAAVLNVGAAALAMAARGPSGARHAPGTVTSSQLASSVTRNGAAVLAMSSGALILMMERLWSRLLTLVLGHDTYGFASMLVTAILGLSIGGAVAGWISARGRSTLGWGAAMLMVAGASSLGCFWLTGWLLERSAGDPFSILAAGALTTTPSMGLVHPLVLSLLPALLPSIAAGAVFPLACAAVNPHPVATGTEVGRITAFNAAGCVLGALLPTVGIVQWLGVHGSVAAGAAAASVAGAVVMLRAVERRSTAMRVCAAAGLAAVALMIVIAPSGTVRRITNVMVGGQVEQIVYHAEGRTGTVTVTRNRIDGVKTLFVNAVNEVTTRYVHDQSFSLLGHLGALLHPSPTRGLVICHGAGLTASALATHETMQVTVVDLEGRVVEAAREFSDLNGNLHENPRVDVLVEDGRNHLLSTDERYDVITVDSTHPRAVDSWVLYTTQFYALARSRLSQDGIIVQWVPMHGMSESEFRILVNTFIEVFPQAQLWANVGYDRIGFTGYALMVASASGDLVVDTERISGRMKKPAVHAEMSRWGLVETVDVLDCFIAGPRRLEAWTEDLPVNTDDRPLTPWVTGWSRGRRMGPQILSQLAEPIGDLLETPAAGADQLAHQLADLGKAEGFLLRGEVMRAAEVIPDSPRLRRYVSEHGEAIAYNRKLAADQNTNHRVLLAAGTALDALGDHRSALEILRRASSLEPGDARTWLGLGLTYAHMGRHEDAERAHDRVLQLKPDSALGHVNAALAIMQMGDPYEATEVLREAARSDPSFHRTWLHLGEAHLARGEPQIALEHLDRAARLVDSDPQVHHMRGRALAELKNWPEALAAFDAAIALDPWWFAPHYERGLALLATTGFESAQRAFERAVDIDPRSATAWTDLGLALAGQGMWPEAAQAHLTATDLDDRLARAWLNMGLALKALGEMQAAEASFRKALSIDPEIAGR